MVQMSEHDIYDAADALRKSKKDGYLHRRCGGIDRVTAGELLLRGVYTAICGAHLELKM